MDRRSTGIPSPDDILLFCLIRMPCRLPCEQALQQNPQATINFHQQDLTMSKPIAVSLTLVLFVLGAAVHGGDAAKDDAKKIQGTWKVVKAQVDGKDAGGET